MNSISSRVEQTRQLSKGLEFLFGTRAAGVCAMHKCSRTHFLFTEPDTQTAETVITGIHTMWRPGTLRPLLPPRLPHDNSGPLAMATARCAASGPASPTIPISEYLWDRNWLAAVRRHWLEYSLSSAVTVVSVKSSFLSSNLSPSEETSDESCSLEEARSQNAASQHNWQTGDAIWRQGRRGSVWPDPDSCQTYSDLAHCFFPLCVTITARFCL